MKFCANSKCIIKYFKLNKMTLTNQKSLEIKSNSFRVKETSGTQMKTKSSSDFPFPTKKSSSLLRIEIQSIQLIHIILFFLYIYLIYLIYVSTSILHFLFSSHLLISLFLCFSAAITVS